MNDDGTVTLTQDELNEIQGQLMMLETELSRLMAQPLVYATVVKAENNLKLEVFEHGDRMLVLDPDLRKQKKFFGKIVSQGVDEDGWVIIQYPQGDRDRLNIGLNKQLPQVKLLGKDDGTNVTITLDGKLFEVHGLPGYEFKVSETVKVDMETKQIHSAAGMTSSGDVAFIKAIVDQDHIEVENSSGASRVVLYGLPDAIEPSDRVMLDNSSTVVIRVLERDGKDKFNLTEPSTIGWDDIAGISEAKEQLIEALETPYQHPEVYKFYNMSPPKGILLYGPQGCGKTLTAKAAAASLARVHGKQNFQSGFIYVKGPELLSKYVGQAEQEIRGLFNRGRDHFGKHGYPALLFIDEADALLPMRGTGKSSDIENTIVPQFLSEMDGLQSSGVMVLLATNQPRRLDPAVTREGRIDRSVKINRPHLNNAIEYFRVHMRNLPLAKGLHADEVASIGVQELFSDNHVMYRVNHQRSTELFRLGDAVTGAMIAGVVAQAKSTAMKRDLAKGGKPKGIMVDDFVHAVSQTYVKQADQNITFDLEDFCDRHGFDRKSVNLERLVMNKG